MKKIILASLVAATALFYATPVFAHVLITDSTHTKGSILHIAPDDDPIAGEKATLYFDIQKQLSKSSEVALTVIDSSDRASTLKATTDGSLAAVSYIFPTQGIYELTLTIKDGREVYTFNHIQRVSRGATLSVLDGAHHSWAVALLITAIISLTVSLIIAFNRREVIARHSTF